eukprot:64246-Chlamydomonas_euryale.AAC.1
MEEGVALSHPASVERVDAASSERVDAPQPLRPRARRVPVDPASLRRGGRDLLAGEPRDRHRIVTASPHL